MSTKIEIHRAVRPHLKIPVLQTLTVVCLAASLVLASTSTAQTDNRQKGNAISIDSLVGAYQHDPVENESHNVIIERGTDGNLRWTNAAGKAWTLEIRDGELWTAEDSPYGESKLEIKKDASGKVSGIQQGESLFRLVDSDDHHYFHAEEKPHAAKWSYSGDTGPAHWGDLDESYSAAKTGKSQSPIDISVTIDKELPELEISYKSTRVHLINNGHTIKQDDQSEQAGHFTAGDYKYELKQFHFHSPSEHTVGGEHFPMEMHLVHKSPDEKTVAVIAVFIEQGEEHNEAFDPVWFLLPAAGGTEQNREDTIDTGALLPTQYQYFSYDGSFTTPPCTEQVKWFVLQTPISLSKQQIDRFRAVVDGNNRPVQKLNGREIRESK